MVEISNKDNNKVVRVSVKSGTGKTPVIPNKDYTNYYANLSRAWAIKMNGLVDKEDYSSKYYATQAKDNAEITENNLNSIIAEHEEITTEITDARQDIADDLTNAQSTIATDLSNAQTSIATDLSGALSDMAAQKTAYDNNATEKTTALKNQYDTATADLTTQLNNATTEITDAKDNAINKITTVEDNAEKNITTAKTNALNAIDKEGVTQVSNIKQTGFYMQDGKLYYLDSEGNPQEFKSGGDTPTNMVTTDTAQTVTGAKTFQPTTGRTTFNDGTTSNYIQIGKDTSTDLPKGAIIFGSSAAGIKGIKTNNSGDTFKISSAGHTQIQTNGNTYITSGIATSSKNGIYLPPTSASNGSVSLWGGSNSQNSSAGADGLLRVGKEGSGTYYSRKGVFIETTNQRKLWLGQTNYRSSIEAGISSSLDGKYVQINLSPDETENAVLTLSKKKLTYYTPDGVEHDLLAGGSTEGIPEWNKDTTYNKGSIIKLVSDTKIVLYNSLQDNNKNNALTNTDYWEKLNLGGSGKELLEIYIDPFCDESENKGRIANGQIIVQNQFPEATKKLKKRVGWDSENKKATLNTSLVCTEEEWQAIKTASKLGQCGKFVIDDEAGTIRLPAIVNINGLTDLSKCGLIKDESLPAHKHSRGSMNITGSFSESKLEQYETSGSFYYDGGVGSNSQAAGGGGRRIRFSADRAWTGSTSVPDNSTYQDNAPVQQEAVQYPYVICVNTGVEEAERPINNYQVNNVYSYGVSQYYKGTMNNLSWLRSAGQWNPGTTYIGVYNWAVAQQVAGVDGFKLSTEEYTDYDWVINTEEQTFRLPLLNGDEALVGTKTADMNITASPFTYTAPANGWLYMSGTADSNVNQYITVYIDGAKTMPIIGRNPLTQASITYLVPVKRNQTVIIEYTATNISRCKFIYAEGNGNLYYYVGDTLQNADLINIARMQEQITDINAQSRGYLVESYTDGTSGYRLYSDGFCEQRGYSNVDSNDLRTITFLKPYKDTNYVVTLGSSNINDNNQNSRIAKVASITTKNMVVTGIFNNALGADFHFYWRTCGYVK